MVMAFIASTLSGSSCKMDYWQGDGGLLPLDEFWFPHRHQRDSQVKIFRGINVII